MARKHGDSPRKDPWALLRHTSADLSFSLAALDPAAKPFSTGHKKGDRELVERLAIELDELQNVFYADRRYKLLIVLQGIDTSGKDGTLRAVFSRTTPLGVRTVALKAPTETERSHDFLWRIHQQAPAPARSWPSTGATTKTCSSPWSAAASMRPRRSAATPRSIPLNACWPSSAR